MTIHEEIEQLKIKLEQTADEKEQAEVLVELLRKLAFIHSADMQPYVDRLSLLAQRLNEPIYQAWAALYIALCISEQTGSLDDKIILDLTSQAIALFGETNNKNGIAACYSFLGNLYYRQSNYPEAIKNYALSGQFYREGSDRKGTAISLFHLGRVYEKQGKYNEAIKEFLGAITIFEEIGNKEWLADCYTVTGIVNFRQGNYTVALQNHFASLKLNEERNNPRGISCDYINIGLVYSKQLNFSEALKNQYAGLKFAEETGFKENIAKALSNIGAIYTNQRSYTEALNSYLRSLKLAEEMQDKYFASGVQMNIGVLYAKEKNYPEALKYYFSALEKVIEIGHKWGIAGCCANIGDVYQNQEKYPEALKEYFQTWQIANEIGNKDLIKESSFGLTNTYRLMGDFENALKYFEKYYDTEKDMLGEESTKQLNQLSFTHNLEQKEKDLEIEQLRNVELKKERDRSETLLLNILPAEVAEELKNKGSADAKLFDDVTVLFTDFKSFTKVSERLTPQQLVDELNVCFSAFDGIMVKYNIEKIKTVGDAYLAVSGLPLATPNHAADVVNAAIEIREFIKQRRAKKGEDTFDIRIGVHSGSVVAGIVGVKKFAYDIWGDTVNTAARMEQNSEAGKINISQTTYDLVKDKFNCDYRGEIEAKNKGKLKMYFVN